MRPLRTYVQYDDGKVEAYCTRCGARFEASIHAGWSPHEEGAFVCVSCVQEANEIQTHDEVPNTRAETGRHK